MSQKKGTIDAAMLLSAEAAVEAAAESVARFGMDVDDFATLAKAKLLETYVAMARREIREQEEKVANFERQLASMKRTNRATPSAVSVTEETVCSSPLLDRYSTKTITPPPSRPAPMP